MNWKRRVVLVVVLFIFLSGFDFLPIGYFTVFEIRSNAEKLDGKEVKIKGTVTSLNKIWGVSSKIFKIKDKTGEIYVITQGNLPNMNETITIKAVVDNALIVAGKNFGVHLKENKRY